MENAEKEDDEENSKSVLSKEYDNIEYLGRGGYGNVLKGRNKLDNQVYAIKRIRLSQTDEAENTKLIQEVELLASLDHPNIVRFHHAWREEVKRGTETGASATESEGSSQEISEVNSNPIPTEDSGSIEDSGSNEHAEESASLGSDGIDFNEDFNGNNGRTGITRELSVWDIGSGGEGYCGHGLSGVLAGEGEAYWSPSATVSKLYIKMQFCPDTLRSMIDNGHLRCDKNLAVQFSLEIAAGLAFIHSKGIVHRDVNAANIFIDQNKTIKIGDFGLATKGKSSPIMTAVTADQNASEMTGNIGTFPYIAPEVLDCLKTALNPKTDMYAVGIIMFEMFHPMDSGSERAEVMTGLREKNIIFPSTWDNSLERVTDLIRRLLDHNPDNRLRACQLEMMKRPDLLVRALPTKRTNECQDSGRLLKAKKVSSAQWAEFSRAIGEIRKAEAIEAKIREKPSPKY